MDRLESRELFYFVTVAEELHFGRAAQRIGIAQPPLSRAIKQLERRIGVTLFERSSRAVSLTVAGEVLYHEGRKVLEALSAVTRRAQRAGQAYPELVLALKPGGDGGLLPGILTRYAAAPESIPVEMLSCGIGEQAALIREGRADLALMHRPLGSGQGMTGLDTAELLVERQVLVVPRHRHRLADRDVVHTSDLVGETVPRWPGAPDDARGPEVRDAGQLMQLIALGYTVAVLPESIRWQLRSDLVCIPVADAPPTSMLLAWAEDDRSPALGAFVRTAMTVAEQAVAAGTGSMH